MRLLSALTAVVLVPSWGPAQEADFYDLDTLRTIDLVFEQPDWWQQLLDNKEPKVPIPADLTVDGTLYEDVGVRFKGNSSYFSTQNSDKKPFHIGLDEFVDGQELQGYDVITLNNAFKDPTFMREPLAYRIMRDFMPAPRANWVVLRINGENWGVYVNVQKADKSLLDEWFPSQDGNRYKALPHQADLVWKGQEASAYQQSYELKSDEGPESWVDLVDMIDVLNNTSGMGLLQQLDARIAVDRTLWHLAAQNLLLNLDSYVQTANNYYLYHDTFHDRMSLIPWDLNEAFGCFTNGLSIPQLQTLDPLYKSEVNNRPLFTKLVDLGPTRDRYFAHYRTIRDRWFDWSILGPWIQTYQDLIRDEVYADTKKLYTSELFEKGVTEDISLGGGPGPGPGAQIPGLQPLVEERTAFLLAHPEVSKASPTIDAVGISPLEPVDGEPVFVTVASTPPAGQSIWFVRLHWRVQGAFDHTDMFDDGQHGDGQPDDGVWGLEIPGYPAGSRVEFFFESTTPPGPGGPALVCEPLAAEHAPHSYVVLSDNVDLPLRLNEFMADNEASSSDEAGEFDDWLEILNTGDADLDLGGLHLTDDLTNSSKWTIPGGVVAPAHGTVLFWADEDQEQGATHTNFKLGAGGEEIGLFASDGLSAIDTIVFGSQAADISTGRLFDGDALWVTLLDPTPGASNEAAAGTARRYSALDPASHPAALALAGMPVLGANVSLDVADGPSGGLLVLAFGALPAYVPLLDWGVLLIDPASMDVFATSLGASGAASLPIAIPTTPELAGVPVRFQAWCVDPAQGSVTASNALEAVLGP